MGKASGRHDFEWVYNDQPHTSRRKEILGKEIKFASFSKVINEFSGSCKIKGGRFVSSLPQPVKPVYELLLNETSALILSKVKYRTATFLESYHILRV